MAARIVNPGSNVKWYAQASGVTVVGATKTYATYREMINDPNPSRLGWVTDASGDPTVDSGSALYAHNGSVWTKIYETEIMDAGASNFVGWYPNVAALQAQYPSASLCTDGMYAILGDTDSIWVWDSDTGTWKDTATMGNQIHWAQIIDPPTSYPISFISGLQDALDAKYSITVADQTFAKQTSLANVAFSGSYTDLINVPDIAGLTSRVTAAENNIVTNGQRIDSINSSLVTINQDIAARLTIAVAESLYATKEYVDTALEPYLLTDDAVNTYLSKTDASSVYLKKTDAQSTYDTITSVNNKLTVYLTIDGAQETYLSKSDAIQLYAGITHTHDDLYMRTTAIQSDYYTKVQSDARFASFNHTHADYALSSNVMSTLPAGDLVNGNIYIPYIDWASIDDRDKVSLKAGTIGASATCIELVLPQGGYWQTSDPYAPYAIPTINGMLDAISVSGTENNIVSIGYNGRPSDSGYSIVDGIGISGGTTAVPTASAVREYVNNALAGFSDVFIYKGTVADTTELYAISNAKVGDVYHVTADQGEYVCKDPANVTPADRWESLGGIFNVGNLVEKITGTAHTVVKLAADGGIEASDYTTGSGALSSPANATTLATEQAVKDYADGREVAAKNYADGLAGGKLDKLSGATNNNLLVVGGTGSAVADSGVSVGGDTLTIVGGTAGVDKVATEAAVKNYTDTTVATGDRAVTDMLLEAIGNIQLLIPSGMTNDPMFFRLEFYNQPTMTGTPTDTREYSPNTQGDYITTADFKIFDASSGFIPPPVDVNTGLASGIPRTYAGTFVNIGTYDPGNIDLLSKILNGVDYPTKRAYVKYLWYTMNGSVEVPVIEGAFMYPSFVVADPLSIGYYWQTASVTP